MLNGERAKREKLEMRVGCVVGLSLDAIFDQLGSRV
jgi:hypothetical protein